MARSMHGEKQGSGGGNMKGRSYLEDLELD